VNAQKQALDLETVLAVLEAKEIAPARGRNQSVVIAGIVETPTF
jgi:hypothetical protein